MPSFLCYHSDLQMVRICHWNVEGFPKVGGKMLFWGHPIQSVIIASWFQPDSDINYSGLRLVCVCNCSYQADYWYAPHRPLLQWEWRHSSSGSSPSQQSYLIKNGFLCRNWRLFREGYLGSIRVASFYWEKDLFNFYHITEKIRESFYKEGQVL